MASPFFSVIIPAHREGFLIRPAIESILAQSEQDFEILLVDDGADAVTKQVMRSINHRKLKIIEQTNDGPSSARNRALRHTRGRYLCFLDGDDACPPWALRAIREQLEVAPVDVVFTSATVLTRERETHPFYDEHILQQLRNISQAGVFTQERGNIDTGAKYLGFLEPSSAVKVLSSSFVKKIGLAYPNGLFFEDIFTHVQIIANLQSFSVVPVTQFTYHLAYGHAQTTSGSTERRFDAISSSFAALDLLFHAARYNDYDFRFGVFHGIARLLSWCEFEVNHIHKRQFRSALRYAFAGLPPNVLGDAGSDILVPAMFEHVAEAAAVDFLKRYLVR